MKLKFTFLITALLMLGNLTTWGQTTVTISATYGGTNTGWVTPGNGSSYWYLFKDLIIESPSIPESSISSIVLNARKYGGPSVAEALITISFVADDGGGVTVLGTISPSSTSLTNYTLSNLNSTTSGKIRIECKGASSSKSSGVKIVTINYTPAPTGPTQLTAPTDFSGTPGNEQIAFSWTAVANASSYLISYTPAGGTELTQAVTGATTNSYTLTGLTNDIVYSCKIKAVGDGTTYSDSDYSTAISVEPTDATLYTITLNETTGGTITCDKTTAEAGETITLTAAPAAGYGFTLWYAMDGDANEITVTDNQFTMPASDVEVEATFTAYTISATSNDPSLGSVSLSGNVITATVATGCRINAATPYEVTVGTATVTQNDNEFTVVATSNCTVQIKFELIPTYTVTFNAGTGSVSPTSLTGATIDLSTLTVTPPIGWTFYGWATDEVEATPTAPTIISGTTYTPTADVPLYAVYSKSEGSEPALTTTSYSAQNPDWTVVENGGVNNYWQLFNQNSNYITSPTIDISTITSIEVQMGTYGGTNGNELNIFNVSNSLLMGTKTATSTTQSTHYTIESLENKTGVGKVKFYSKYAGTGNVGLRVLSVTINYQATAYTYNTNPAANGPCATPTFSLAEGYYYAEQSVELSCETTGATIRYTIDGTDPTAESTVYGTESIAVNATTTIKAKAYCNGYDPSEIATATYNFMPDVAGSYVIAYKDGGNYYAMSQTANEYGEKLTSQAVTLNGVGKVVTSVNGGLLWTIANTTSGVAIKPYNTTNYLNIGSSTLTIGTTEDYFQVIASTDGSYNFKDISSDYYVEYYESLFTGFAYNETYASAYNLYLLPYELPTTYTVSIAEGISNGSISSVTSASEDDEITVTVNPNSGYKLSTLYYYTTDPATTTAIDQSTRTFIMPAANVTIEATFEPILYWHITLSENGYTSIINVQQGLSTTLSAPTTTPDGYTFVGWSTSTVDVTNSVPTIMDATEYTPSADVTLYAVYAISNVSGNSTWNLVTDASTLAAGDKFMLYGQQSDGTKNHVAGGLSNSILTAISVSAPVNNQISQPDGAEIFTLAAGQDGKWVFVSGNGNLCVQNEKKVMYSETSYTEWAITIDSDGDADIYGDNYHLDFNANSPRFTAYKTSQGYTAIYRYTQESVLMNYSTNVTALSGTLTTQTYNTNCYISGATTIPTGVTVTCNYGLGNTTAANLIIEDGGQLIINNSGVKATVKKEIAAWVNDDLDTEENETGGWYSISSPVRNQSIVEMFGEPQTGTITFDLYSYDEPTYTWKNYHSGITESALIPGKGYLTANASLTTREFVGELNTNSITVDLSYASTYDALKGFNFVGNPYSHDITIENNATVSESVATGYYKLNSGAFVASDNNVTIAPKEGFFVLATAADQTIIFKNIQSAKQVANDEYLSIEVNNSKHMDRAYAMFNNVIGLSKINHLNESAPMLYIPQNGKDYAITSVEPTSEYIPVSFEAGVDGTYTITVKQHNCSLEGLKLKDMKTGMLTELSAQNSYTFEAAVGDAQGRFRIILATHGVEEHQANEVFVYQSGNNLIVNGEGWVELIDLQGRVLSRQKVTGNSVNIGNLSAGVYMVRLIDNNKVSTQKVVVK